MRYRDISYALGDTVISLCHRSNEGFVPDVPVFIDEGLTLVECVVVGTSGPTFGNRPTTSTSLRLMGSLRDHDVVYNFNMNRSSIEHLARQLQDNRVISAAQRQFLSRFLIPVPVSSRGYLRMLEDVTRAVRGPDAVPVSPSSEDIERIELEAGELGIDLVRLNRSSPTVRYVPSTDITGLLNDWDNAGGPVIPPDDDDELEMDDEEEF